MKKHGKYGTAEHKAWSGMKYRCGRDKHYLRIKVCERWLSFEAFYEDMGPRPSEAHSLDRINGAGNYEPGNCRWATPVEQNSNRRTVLPVTVGGETMTASAAARLAGIRPAVFIARLRRGWSVERAMETPLLPAGVREDNRMLAALGMTLTLSQWSRRTGISVAAIHRRIRVYGWDHEAAVTTPVRRR